MELSLITIIIFLALLAAAIAVVWAFRNRFEAAEPAESSLRRTLTVVDQSSATTVTGQVDQQFDRLLIESGLPLTSMTAVLVMAATALLVGGIVLLVRDDVLLAALGTLVGFLLPLGFFSFSRRRRLRQIDEQLPDAIDEMSRAIHAGGTLEQAIGMVAGDTSGALGDEFRWCSRQLQLGLPVSTAMRTLSSRVRLLSIRTLAVILAVHHQTGGNLALTLERLAEVTRSRRFFRRQLRSTTSAARLSAQLIAAAAPLLFVILLFVQPDHIRRLLDDNAGRVMLTVGVMLEIIGVVWLSRLMRVDA